MEKNEIEKFSGFEIFSGMSHEELASVMALAKAQNYKAGEVILEESSDSITDFYVIAKGMAKVEIEVSSVVTGDKGMRRLAVLKTGDVFGERGLLKGHRRSAHVAAYSDLRVLKINYHDLEERLAQDPGLGLTFMKNLAAVLSDRLVNLNFLLREKD